MFVCPNLTDLHCNCVAQEELDAIAEKCRNIESLALVAFGPLAPGHLRVAPILRRCIVLRRLKLALYYTHPADFAEMRCAANLEELHFLPISNAGCAALATSAHLPQLRTLFIHGGDVTSASIELIGVRLPQVTRLAVGLTDAGAEDIALLLAQPSVFPRLEALDVARDKDKVARLLAVVRPNVAVSSTRDRLL